MLVFIFRWQFSTDGYDIGFGIYRRTKDSRQKAGNMEEVLPSKRVNSHLILEDGSIRCKQSGTCKTSKINAMILLRDYFHIDLVISLRVAVLINLKIFSYAFLSFRFKIFFTVLSHQMKVTERLYFIVDTLYVKFRENPEHQFWLDQSRPI